VFLPNSKSKKYFRLSVVLTWSLVKERLTPRVRVDIASQEERVAKLIAKTGGVGAVKRKKTADEVDKRPLPPRVSKERRIHELLRNMYGDRTFLDDVIREAGTVHLRSYLSISSGR